MVKKYDFNFNFVQTVHVKLEKSVVKKKAITEESPLADSKGTQPVSCNVCSKIFKDSSMLSIHMWLHTGHGDDEENQEEQERIDDEEQERIDDEEQEMIDDEE